MTGPEPSSEPRPPEPPFYLIVDRSIPPDEVHFRDRHGRTTAVMKLGEGHRVAIPRKANDTIPVEGATTAWACCGNRTRDGHKPTCSKSRSFGQ